MQRFLLLRSERSSSSCSFHRKNRDSLDCNETTMPRTLATIMLCNTRLRNSTFLHEFFRAEHLIHNCIISEMVFLGSPPTLLSAEVQQSLSVDMLVKEKYNLK